MKPQNPIIKRDPDLGWEIFVPSGLLPVELRTVSLSPGGLYVEGVDDSYDLIPFRDLVHLLDQGRTLDENVDIGPVSAIVAALGTNVVIAAGQPEMPLTGQERVFRRWMAEKETFQEAGRD